jgi:Tol biopolymer transport system component
MKHLIAFFTFAILLPSCGKRTGDAPAQDTTKSVTPARQEQAPASERLMLFMRDGDIWTARADGADAKKFLTGYDPEISPDGKSVAFTMYGKGGERWIAVADIGTGNTRRLASVPGTNSYGPAWSPDGRLLAFHHYTDNQWLIGLVAADDRDFRLLPSPAPTTSFQTLSSLCWGRAGRSMLCQDLAALFELDLQGRQLMTMPVHALLGADTTDYDFSSSNKFIQSSDDGLLVCDADRGETFTSSIFLFDRGTKQARMISPKNYHARAPAWLADGRTIVFSGFELTKRNRDRVLSDQPVETSIYSIDVDGSNLKQLIKNGDTPSVSAR